MYGNFPNFSFINLNICLSIIVYSNFMCGYKQVLMSPRFSTHRGGQPNNEKKNSLLLPPIRTTASFYNFDLTNLFQQKFAKIVFTSIYELFR